MPKKFGTNTKSAEARARREEAKQAEKEKKQREAEDALWKEDDKHILRKQHRKEEKEKKKQEQLNRKAALKAAYEEEMSSLKGTKQSAQKLTRAEIAAQLEKLKAEEAAEKELLHDEKPLEENVNRLTFEGDEARNIEEAISILSIKDSKVDQHPERRMKAAFQAFENANLPRLKAENPNLRLSQLKQMLKKDWMKSPENPFNQQTAPYNTKS